MLKHLPNTKCYEDQMAYWCLKIVRASKVFVEDQTLSMYALSVMQYLETPQFYSLVTKQLQITHE